jgi:23S rRNA pseudouridine1911/1915/1917 synthase
MADRHFRVASQGELLPLLMGPPLGLSRKHVKELIRFGAVTLQRKATVRHDTRLEPGDIVTIATRRQVGAAREPRDFRIVYLDDAVAVIDKPSGLLAMGSGREQERTAYRILNDHLKALARTAQQQVFIVHRLDRETSGLMMFARSESVQAIVQQNWTSVTKKYLAVVEGAPADAQGTLKDQLAESRSFKVHRVVRSGEPAVTHYRVLRKSGDKSLLELTLETGRKHQIRVQLAARGFPIIGDQKYGAATDPARRLALHACELKFRHPVSGAAMEFQSALPGPLKALIERSRVAN